MMALSFKWLALLLIFGVTLVAGSYPFFRKYKDKVHRDFPIGESLSAGIFLGAGLIHMMGDASESFYELHFSYPIAFLLVGFTFLFFLLLEHIGQELYPHAGCRDHVGGRNPFAVLAVAMLSMHSFLAGAALGLSDSLALSMIILVAILAHKWAASFALAVQINQANFKMRTAVSMFLIFACMTPVGVLFGLLASQYLAQWPLLEPIFASLAAGTFLYLGTLHGLERAVMIKQCCNLKAFVYVILGFALMAVVAIWV